jgi:hypothetical protein
MGKPNGAPVIESDRQYQLVRARVALLRLGLANLHAVAHLPGFHPGIHQGLIDSRTSELERLEFEIQTYEDRHREEYPAAPRAEQRIR